MGQYYKIVNLDKKEFLDSYSFADGAKLLELACSSSGTLAGLTILLASGNGRGGGDLHSENPVIGSWAGDRIVVAGDYADENLFLSDDQIVKYKLLNEDKSPTLYSYAGNEFKDISRQVLTAMLEDKFIYQTYAETDLYGTAKEVFEEVKKSRGQGQDQGQGMEKETQQTRQKQIAKAG